MDTPFKLLVYAIVAVAVLAILYQIMLPLLFPPLNNIAIIERTLKSSETGLGQGFPSEITVGEEEGFTGETFDTRTRNASFQCNSATLCCPQRKECDLAIEWDHRELSFNKARTFLVTTRCEKEYDLHACTIYVGEAPAQIRIDEMQAPKSVDLSTSQMHFDLEFTNTGKQETQQTEIRIKVYKRYLEEGRWLEKELESAGTTENTGALKPGETKQKKVYLNLSQNGSFKAIVRVSGLEAGYEEKIMQFETSGASDECQAAYCEKPEYSNGSCSARCYCENCMLGSKCTQLLLDSDNVDLGLPHYVSIKDAEPNVLASNIVEMKIEDDLCPRDITLKEPNAIASEIGFQVKNVSPNPILNEFTINAYTGFGTGNQQKVGSVNVAPEEMNDDSKVIKSISATLAPGTYQVTLIANEEKKEIEDDYGNNNITLTVTIPGPPADTSEFENPVNIGPCCGKPFELVGGFVEDDGSPAMTLRHSVEEGKVRADFAGDGFGINAKIQNITNQKIRIMIPLGQIFIDKQEKYQNLGKVFEDSLIELPVCGTWIGRVKTACLNRYKNYPKTNYYDVGEVIEEAAMLSALETGNQSIIWDVIERYSTSPQTYGGYGNVLSPTPTDLLNPLEFTQEECEDAGIIAIPTCTSWDPIPDYDYSIYPTITDPSDVTTPDYCIQP